MRREVWHGNHGKSNLVRDMLISCMSSHSQWSDYFRCTVWKQEFMMQIRMEQKQDPTCIYVWRMPDQEPLNFFGKIFVPLEKGRLGRIIMHREIPFFLMHFLSISPMNSCSNRSRTASTAKREFRFSNIHPLNWTHKPICYNAKCKGNWVQRLDNGVPVPKWKKGGQRMKGVAWESQDHNPRKRKARREGSKKEQQKRDFETFVLSLHIFFSSSLFFGSISLFLLI